MALNTIKQTQTLILFLLQSISRLNQAQNSIHHTILSDIELDNADYNRRVQSSLQFVYSILTRDAVYSIEY